VVTSNGDEEDDFAANVFLFILMATFVAMIAVVIMYCTDKISSKPIILPSARSSSERPSGAGVLSILTLLIAVFGFSL